jgi:hypothetical protein
MSKCLFYEIRFVIILPKARVVSMPSDGCTGIPITACNVIVTHFIPSSSVYLIVSELKADNIANSGHGSKMLRNLLRKPSSLWIQNDIVNSSGVYSRSGGPGRINPSIPCSLSNFRRLYARKQSQFIS